MAISVRQIESKHDVNLQREQRIARIRRGFVLTLSLCCSQALLINLHICFVLGRFGLHPTMWQASETQNATSLFRLYTLYCSPIQEQLIVIYL